VGFGVGAAGIAMGSTFGLIAMSKRSSLDQSCPDPGSCPRTQNNATMLDQLRTSSTLSTVGFAAGGAGVAFGAVWLLLAPEASNRSAFSVQPIVSPRLSGLRGTF
jgi:hypothetical protein